MKCLLLTNDVTTMDVMRSGFSAVNVDLEMREDAASAIELSDRRHLDGFVIDCDGVERATDVLSRIRNSHSNKLSIVFAVVNGATTVSTAIQAGANFVLGKPIQDQSLRSLLDIALPRMLAEHSRYFRHKTDLPADLVRQGGDVISGRMTNVSEGGLALARSRPSSIDGRVTVKFELPSTFPQAFVATADVVWNETVTVGLRFVRMEPGCRSGFAAWLDCLEAQLKFQNS